MFISLLALVLCFLLMFFLIRGVNWLYIDSALTKRQRKKIKSKNFIDWLLLKEYRSALPKSRIVWYFLNFILLAISLIAIVLFYIFDKSEIGSSVVWIYFVINGVWVIAAKMNLLWWVEKYFTLTVLAKRWIFYAIRISN